MLVCYSPLCKVMWGSKLVDGNHVIYLGSKPNSIYFNTETNGGGWVSVLIGSVKEGEMKKTRIVYVRPGSIYLAGPKTSSVQNIVVYWVWLAYITGKISIRQTDFCRDSSPSAIIINTGGSHWLLAASHQHEGEGPCGSFSLHCTQWRESCIFCLWRHVKKLRIPHGRYNENF